MTISDLALFGGVPALKSAISPWPSYSAEEIDRCTKVIASGRVNYWTGNECREFEREFADAHDSAFALALANGTLALELALRVLEIGVGDEVIVTPRSYFASASCVALAGAVPVFADVDTESQNITLDSILPLLSDKTKAIICVHLAGWPCDIERIVEFSRSRNLRVIEDCAQAHGATVGGRKVGSFGDIGTFSFCQDKIMSTLGEGGMLTTQDESVWRAAWSFKDHGKDWELANREDHPIGFRWLHTSIGSNLRLTEVQATVGRYQLGKLDEWVVRRSENRRRFNENFRAHTAIRTTQPADGYGHAGYKYYAFVNESVLAEGWSRDRLLAAFEAEGIPGWSGSCPEIYREAAFFDLNVERLPVAARLGVTSFMLPIHPTISLSEIDDISSAVLKVFDAAVSERWPVQ